MKRTLSMITLAVLTVGLLGSCSKINERLDNLDKRIDGIENEQIATINGQIEGIKNSIKDLGQIRDDIGNLKQTAETHGEDIFALQEADETLGNRIDNLEDYIDNVLPNYAEKEWVEATFSTLEQYDSTCNAIAEINVKIGELDTKIAKDIETCVDSMKTWVNEKLDAYYTAAEMNAELAKMRAAIDSAKAAGKISDTKADSVAAELTKTKTAVDTAKSHIRSEYKAAIKAAIDSTEGKLTKQIQDEIEKVNGKITNLSVRVDALYDEVNFLAGEVKALENMIQSVTIVPEYSDGSVEAVGGTLTLDIIVEPAVAVKGLTKDSFKVLVNEVETKAVKVDTVSVSSITVDATKGTITASANISSKLPEDTTKALTVAVNVKNGISDYTTEFVPVYVVPVEPYVIIEAKYDGNTVTPLKWYRQNLAITVSGNKAWKGGNTSSAVKVPGTNEDVIVGDYFQWAASYNGYKVTENQKPDSLLIYTAFTNQYCGDSEDSFTLKGSKRFVPSDSPYYHPDLDYSKYNSSDSKTVLERTPDNDDVASIILGEDWRMPTSAEFQAMKDTTYWAWDATDKGYYVYTPNPETDAGKVNNDGTGTYDKSDALLFFPAAGFGDGPELKSTGGGFYWLSSFRTNPASNTSAYYLYFSSSKVDPQKYGSRFDGQSVRPVSQINK